jgi:hypothetical protein
MTIGHTAGSALVGARVQVTVGGVSTWVSRATVDTRARTSGGCKASW